MSISREQLNAAMTPRSVAVIGSRRADNHMWLRNMDAFKGKVYSVQIDPAEIPSIEEMGVPNYQSLMEIPDPVDYVIVAVPRRVVPLVLKDAIAKGVKTAHIWTSGFAESGTPEGIELNNQIVQLAKDAGLLVIGPNCMGVFNPEVGLRFGPGQEPREAGSVTFISQSGGLAMGLTQAAHASGVGVNKAVSFGNGILLDSPDLLQYFGEDPTTQIICAYIEGPNDARRFFEALRQTAQRKPVILWKGGQTEEGRRMAASHSASLAGSIEIWDALIRQAGAVRADSLEEAVDVTKAFAYLTPATGDGVGIIGGAGGQSVAMSDAFSRAGLRVPRLSEPTLEGLSSFFQLIGGSYFNPMDVGGPNQTNIESIIDLLARDPHIDAVAVLVGAQGAQRSWEEMLASLEPYRRAREETGKPVLAMFSTPIPYRNGAPMEELDTILQGLEIPVFASPERAARALKKMVDYYRLRQSLEDNGPGSV